MEAGGWGGVGVGTWLVEAVGCCDVGGIGGCAVEGGTLFGEVAVGVVAVEASGEVDHLLPRRVVIVRHDCSRESAARAQSRMRRVRMLLVERSFSTSYEIGKALSS